MSPGVENSSKLGSRVSDQLQVAETQLKEGLKESDPNKVSVAFASISLLFSTRGYNGLNASEQYKVAKLFQETKKEIPWVAAVTLLTTQQELDQASNTNQNQDSILRSIERFKLITELKTKRCSLRTLLASTDPAEYESLKKWEGEMERSHLKLSRFDRIEAKAVVPLDSTIVNALGRISYRGILSYGDEILTEKILARPLAAASIVSSEQNLKLSAWLRQLSVEPDANHHHLALATTAILIKELKPESWKALSPPTLRAELEKLATNESPQVFVNRVLKERRAGNLALSYAGELAARELEQIVNGSDSWINSWNSSLNWAAVHLPLMVVGGTAAAIFKAPVSLLLRGAAVNAEAGLITLGLAETATVTGVTGATAARSYAALKGVGGIAARTGVFFAEELAGALGMTLTTTSIRRIFGDATAFDNFLDQVASTWVDIGALSLVKKGVYKGAAKLVNKDELKFFVEVIKKINPQSSVSEIRQVALKQVISNSIGKKIGLDAIDFSAECLTLVAIDTFRKINSGITTLDKFLEGPGFIQQLTSAAVTVIGLKAGNSLAAPFTQRLSNWSKNLLRQQSKKDNVVPIDREKTREDPGNKPLGNFYYLHLQTIKNGEFEKLPRSITGNEKSDTTNRELIIRKFLGDPQNSNFLNNENWLQAAHKWIGGATKFEAFKLSLSGPLTMVAAAMQFSPKPYALQFTLYFDPNDNRPPQKMDFRCMLPSHLNSNEQRLASIFSSRKHVADILVELSNSLKKEGSAHPLLDAISLLSRAEVGSDKIKKEAFEDAVVTFLESGNNIESFLKSTRSLLEKGNSLERRELDIVNDSLSILNLLQEKKSRVVRPFAEGIKQIPRDFLTEANRVGYLDQTDFKRSINALHLASKIKFQVPIVEIYRVCSKPSSLEELRYAIETFDSWIGGHNQAAVISRLNDNLKMQISTPSVDSEQLYQTAIELFTLYEKKAPAEKAKYPLIYIAIRNYFTESSAGATADHTKNFEKAIKVLGLCLDSDVHISQSQLAHLALALKNSTHLPVETLSKFIDIAEREGIRVPDEVIDQSLKIAGKSRHEICKRVYSNLKFYNPVKAFEMKDIFRFLNIQPEPEAAPQPIITPKPPAPTNSKPSNPSLKFPGMPEPLPPTQPAPELLPRRFKAVEVGKATEETWNFLKNELPDLIRLQQMTPEQIVTSLKTILKIKGAMNSITNLSMRTRIDQLCKQGRVDIDKILSNTSLQDYNPKDSIDILTLLLNPKFQISENIDRLLDVIFKAGKNRADLNIESDQLFELGHLLAKNKHYDPRLTNLIIHEFRDNLTYIEPKNVINGIKVIADHLQKIPDEVSDQVIIDAAKDSSILVPKLIDLAYALYQVKHELSRILVAEIIPSKENIPPKSMKELDHLSKVLNINFKPELARQISEEVGNHLAERRDESPSLQKLRTALMKQMGSQIESIRIEASVEAYAVDMLIKLTGGQEVILEMDGERYHNSFELRDGKFEIIPNRTNGHQKIRDEILTRTGKPVVRMMWNEYDQPSDPETSGIQNLINLINAAANVTSPASVHP